MIRGIRRPIRLKEGDGTSPEASSKRFEYELDIIDPLVMYKPLTASQAAEKIPLFLYANIGRKNSSQTRNPTSKK
jgi:hypothetical protein